MIDASVLKKPVVDLVVRAKRAVQGRDHAGRHGIRETEGIADGDDRLADHQIAGRAGGDPGQLLLGLQAQYGEVVVRVGTDQFGLVLSAVRQRDPDDIGSGDHMGVGQDVAIRIDQHAGAQALGLLLESGLEEVPKEAIEEGISAPARAALPSRLLGGDVDHRRTHPADRLDRRRSPQEGVRRRRRVGRSEAGNAEQNCGEKATS